MSARDLRADAPRRGRRYSSLVSRDHDASAGRPRLDALVSTERIAAVQRVISRGPATARLDRLVAFAAELVGAPFAQVSLLTGDTQVIAATHGFVVADEGRQGPIEDSLCTVTAASGEPLVVSDARGHPWVRDLPPVVSGAIGSYLGVVLRDGSGHVLGSLCVHDPAQRAWSDEHVRQLTRVADLVAAELVGHAKRVVADETGLRARLAADAAELGSFVYDFAGTGAVDWDDRMLALHGFTTETFGGDLASFEAVVHPDDLPGALQRFQSARDMCGELSIEYRVLLPDGRTRWIRVRGRVVPDMLGAPSHVLGAAYDASTERNLRDELIRLMETMPAALVRIDRSGTVTYVNAVAEDLYGRRREDLLGLDVWAAFPQALGTVLEQAYTAASETGVPGMVETFYPPLDAHFEVRTWPDRQGLTVFVHDVTDRHRARVALEQVSQRLSVLADAGSRLAGSLRPGQVLEVLADLVVPRLGRSVVLAVTDPVGELLGLSVGNDPTRLHAVQVRHGHPAAQSEPGAVGQHPDLRSTGDTPLGRAVRTGQPVRGLRDQDVSPARALDDGDDAQAARLDGGPQLTVPLRASWGVLGAFTVSGSDDQPLDEVLLLDLGTRAAVALENALSFARQDRAATVLQRALLPRTAPAVPGVQVATRYLPANAAALAGGDFFKTVAVDGRLVCALGDVMGHGTRSAARAGQLHGLVAALALQGLGPGELLTQLASGIGQMMDLELATLLVCSYDPVTRRLTTATAGHPPPLIAPVQGEPYYLDVEPGAPIGVAADTYPEHTCELERGSTTVLFSDGLVERRSESIDDGLERLRAALGSRRQPPEAVADHLLRCLGAQGGGDDDIALLVLSHL